MPMTNQATKGSWLPFLAPIREMLERLRPPEGPFSAQADWEHR